MCKLSTSLLILISVLNPFTFITVLYLLSVGFTWFYTLDSASSAEWQHYVIPNLIGDPVFPFFFFVIFIFCNSWNLQTWIYVIFLSNIKRKKYFLDYRNRSEWQIGLGNDKDRECLEWQRGVCGMTVLTFRFFVYRCNWFKNYLLTN